MLTYNGKPITVATNRFSKSGVKRVKRGVIVHTYEAGEMLSMDRIVANLGTPGLRKVPDSNPVRFYGSCYHAFPDYRNAGYVQVLEADCGPFSAPPLNKDFWHICIPGFARQTRAEWSDSVSTAQIQGVAKFIADKAGIDHFLLWHDTPNALKTGGTGLFGHRDVTTAYGPIGGHTDPGPAFPWDVLLGRVADLVCKEWDWATVADAQAALKVPVTGYWDRPTAVNYRNLCLFLAALGK